MTERLGSFIRAEEVKNFKGNQPQLVSGRDDQPGRVRMNLGASMANHVALPAEADGFGAVGATP